MNIVSELITSVIPVLGIVSVVIIIIVLIVVTGRSKQAQSMTANEELFKELAQELKTDHAKMKEELAIMKETLDSINKMMKEIQ